MTRQQERTYYKSPAGWIELRTSGGRLAHVALCGLDDPAPGGQQAPDSETASRFVRALDRYFATAELTLATSHIDLTAASEFERQVLAELMRVPAGRVITYGELAERIGRPGAARAVGRAVGRNPLPIFVPCHRVVAANGRLGGFSAGLEWKRRLLRHEGWTIKEGRIMRATGSRVGVYAGSFDPPTMGHMYMIAQGAGLFDHLIVAVGVNPHKRYTFALDERLEMLRECTRPFPNVEVDSFEGQFLVHYAQSKGAGFVLRGIRTEEDYRFEHAMRNINADLEPDIVAVFLIPPREICEVSSSFVKGLIGFEEWQDVVKPYVPEAVYRRLLAGDVRFAHPGPGADGDAD